MMDAMEKIHPETLAIMRERGGEWYAYENCDLGHPDLGHLTFLKCGPGCTFEEPPKRHPDTDRIMYRYLLVGRVDLDKGLVTTEDGTDDE